jgi:hypothetical protein
MKTQKVPGQVPETIAGPRERAGLMEHPAAAEQAERAVCQHHRQASDTVAELLQLRRCVQPPTVDWQQHSVTAEDSKACKGGGAGDQHHALAAAARRC